MEKTETRSLKAVRGLSRVELLGRVGLLSQAEHLVFPSVFVFAP